METLRPAGPPSAISAAKNAIEVPTRVYPLVTNSASPPAGSPRSTTTVAAASPAERLPDAARTTANPTTIT